MTEVKFHFNTPEETIASSNGGRELEKEEIQLPHSSFQSETRCKELTLSLLSRRLPRPGGTANSRAAAAPRRPPGTAPAPPAQPQRRRPQLCERWSAGRETLIPPNLRPDTSNSRLRVCIRSPQPCGGPLSYGDAQRCHGTRTAAVCQTDPPYTLHLSPDAQPQRDEVFMLAQSVFWFVF